MCGTSINADKKLDITLLEKFKNKKFAILLVLAIFFGLVFIKSFVYHSQAPATNSEKTPKIATALFQGTQNNNDQAANHQNKSASSIPSPINGIPQGKSGYLEIEINDIKRIYYSTNTMFLSKRWETYFFSREGEAEDSFNIVISNDMASKGSTITYAYSAGNYPLSYSRSKKLTDVYFFPGKFNEFITDKYRYSSSCKISILEWGGYGGIASGEIYADLTFATGEKVNFRYGKFKFMIPSSGF